MSNSSVAGMFPLADRTSDRFAWSSVWLHQQNHTWNTVLAQVKFLFNSQNVILFYLKFVRPCLMSTLYD